jgi:hypothetical protein
VSRKWVVYTPEYGTVVPILDDGSGPTEYGADVLYVRAATRQRAKVLAVQAWRHNRGRPSWMHHGAWLERQDSDGACPFTGLKVEPAEYSWRDDALDDYDPEAP